MDNEQIITGLRLSTGSTARRTAAALIALLALCATLVTTGAPARAAAPDTNWVATWNMQVGTDRWAGAAVIARQNAVVALQEVPNTQPAGSYYQGRTGNVDSYLWDIGGGNYRYLYILNQPSRNVGIVTSWYPDAVTEVPGPYRSALAVTRNADSAVFASIHAASGSGFDVPALLQNVANEAAARGAANWAVLGDFNRAPWTLLPYNTPAGSRVYNTGLATQLSGGELDYMVSNVNTQNWQASRGANRGSDHWPVFFGALRAAAEPRELTIHADNSDRLLNVYQGEDTNGTHVIIYHDDGAANSRWRLVPSDYTSSSGAQLYRIVSSDNNMCVDVDRGQSSGNGSYLNIWQCHGPEGQPDSGGPQRDTQNFTLEHPDSFRPNLTLLRDNSTGLYANVRGNQTQDGAWVIQWPDQFGGIPAPNETFYIHPVVE